MSNNKGKNSLMNNSDETTNEEEVIFVISRTGQKELLDTNQITKRLQTLIKKTPKINHVNPM
jgi:hypothetical protein